EIALPSGRPPPHSGAARLRRDSEAVARIKNSLSDIRQIQDLCSQPFQADSETSVWRHPQIEHREMTLKGGGIEASLLQGRFEVLSPMQPLAASGDLDTLK